MFLEILYKENSESGGCLLKVKGNSENNILGQFVNCIKAKNICGFNFMVCQPKQNSSVEQRGPSSMWKKKTC